MKHIQQYIEQFHLLFLDNLGRKLDRRLYALKGGCNLRFYFKSMRYSEDIDLDVYKIRKDTLWKNVQSILESKSLNTNLLARNIKIENISYPKQTEITQRWKVALTATSSGKNNALHTKIEFSRRGLNGVVLFEPIDTLISGQYQLPPIITCHYDKATAIAQKIIALAERKLTQTRDVFDLYLLLGSSNELPKIIASQETFLQAQKNLSSLSFQDFQSQVVAFLTEEYQNQYSNPEVWQLIVNNVGQALARGA
ncbi:MAG: nucleotidyl transferase AbiEii/AbiGii toxin family protein [Gammaproteobacteria bacterium]